MLLLKYGFATVTSVVEDISFNKCIVSAYNINENSIYIYIYIVIILLA